MLKSSIRYWYPNFLFSFVQEFSWVNLKNDELKEIDVILCNYIFDVAENYTVPEILHPDTVIDRFRKRKHSYLYITSRSRT